MYIILYENEFLQKVITEISLRCPQNKGHSA